MGNFEDELSSIAASSGTPEGKLQQYKALVSRVFETGNIEVVNGFFANVVSDQVQLPVSKPIVGEMVEYLSQVEGKEKKTLAQGFLEMLQPRQAAFDSQYISLCQVLADEFEAESEFKKAAEMLGRMRVLLESGTRALDTEFRAGIYVRIAQLYLEEEEDGHADSYLNRANELVSRVKDTMLLLKYDVCFTKILDFKRKFHEACRKWYQLSQHPLVPEDEQVETLKSAAICAILSPAGPQRSRLLSMLFKDERSASLEIYSILQKMYLERMLNKKEVEWFSGHLLDHQKAQGSDGYTVLQRAVIEHNLLSASKIYINISFKQLASLLELEDDGGPEKAEKIAAKMMQEGRMSGSIDQLEELILFKSESNSFGRWDHQVENTCLQLQNVIESLTTLHPALTTGV